MGRKTVCVCDRCGVQFDEKLAFFIQTGWQPDGAGGPSESVGRDIDLCETCARIALEFLLGRIPDFDAAKQVILRLTQK